MMGLEIPQNRGALLPISLFGLAQESEFGKEFRQSGFYKLLFKLYKVNHSSLDFVNKIV